MARSALLAESCRGIWGVCKAPGTQSCAGGAEPHSVLYSSCEPLSRQEPGPEPLWRISLFSHACPRQIPILPETEATIIHNSSGAELHQGAT